MVGVFGRGERLTSYSWDFLCGYFQKKSRKIVDWNVNLILHLETPFSTGIFDLITDFCTTFYESDP